MLGPHAPPPVPAAPSRDAEAAADAELQAALGVVRRAWSRYRYAYAFTWLGVPVIQLPQDLVALQEIVWATRPERIVETGVAHGGSLLFFASLLRLLGGDRLAIGVEAALRPENRAVIEAHPLADAVRLVEGSSTDPAVVARVAAAVAGRRTMVVLDSDHTAAHVAAELAAYAPLVAAGCYCCVMDTHIAAMPEGLYPDRPWGAGDNPAVAVAAFLAARPDFVADVAFDAKLGVTMAPGGYLRRLPVPRNGESPTA